MTSDYTYPLSTYDLNGDSNTGIINPPHMKGEGVSQNDVQTAIGTAVEKLATKEEVQDAADKAVAKIVANAPEAYDTLKEIADWIASDDTKSAEITAKIEANSTNIQNVANNLNDVSKNLSTNMSNLGENLAKNITSVQDNLNSKIETVRKTSDKAKQIADTAYENDKYTRELVDKVGTDIKTLGTTVDGKQDKGNYALNGASYTKEESDAKYLTEHQSLDSYAKIADVNAGLSKKANSDDVYTKSEIDAKGFLIEHQDISNLATKDEVQNAVNTAVEKTNEDINSLKANKADASNVYTKEESDTKYLTGHQSLEDYTKKEDVDVLNSKINYLTKAVAALSSVSTSEDAIANVLSADADIQLPEGKYTTDAPLNINKTIKIQ